MRARVFGGSANIDTAQPPRIVEVYWDKSESWALDLEVSGGPAVLVDVQSGTDQASVLRSYRCETGRMLLPVSGSFVVVDVRPDGAPAAPFARVIGFLALDPCINAPIGPSTATGQTVVAVAGTTPIPQSSGAGRIVRNDSGANITLQLGGVDVFVLAAGAVLEMAYCGAFSIVSVAGGNVRLVTLHA